jgi:hypothetical protein
MSGLVWAGRAMVATQDHRLGAALSGSVVLRTGGHMWVNTLHGAVLGGLFLVLLVLALLSVWQLQPGELTDAGREAALRRARRTMIAALAVGWVAVLTGSFVVDVWFGARTATSPAALLRAQPGDAVWADTVLELKEVVSWASVIVLTVAVWLGLRRGGVALLAGAGGRRYVLALLGVTLACASVGGALGVLLTKLAPLPGGHGVRAPWPPPFWGSAPGSSPWACSRSSTRRSIRPNGSRPPAARPA